MRNRRVGSEIEFKKTKELYSLSTSTVLSMEPTNEKSACDNSLYL